MVTAKRLTVSMIALLAGFSLAHAQTTPGADPHHPETQTQGAKPGAPMTPPPAKRAPWAWTWAKRWAAA